MYPEQEVLAGKYRANPDGLMPVSWGPEGRFASFGGLMNPWQAQTG